jgi:hypothetical protein
VASVWADVRWEGWDGSIVTEVSAERKLMEGLQRIERDDITTAKMTSGQDILRGLIKRFIPGCIGVIAGLLVALAGPNEIPWSFWASIVLGNSVGFGAGLLGLRKRLDPAAEVQGRRSLIAGALAPLAAGVLTFIAGTTGGLGLVAMSALAGAGSALAMYFPWLSEPASSESDWPQIPTPGEVPGISGEK